MNSDRFQTPRQRLFCALEGGPTDRTPVWLLFPYHPTGYYVDVRSHPDYRRVFDFSREHGVIMLNRRNLGAPLHTREVVSVEEDVTTGRGPVRRRTLRCGGLRVHADQPRGPDAAARKLLSSDEDLEAYCRLPIEDDPRAIDAALEAQLDKYRREKSEFPSDQGAMMLDLGSPVNPL